MIIWLDNRGSNSAMDNIFGALAVLNGQSAPVKTARKPAAALYARSLLLSGEDIAFAGLVSMAADTVHYQLDEGALNDLGYEFFGQDKAQLSLQTFRAALAVFPQSDNLYNSYGEVLVKTGHKAAGVQMYQKSLLLNPKNEDSKKALAELLGK